MKIRLMMLVALISLGLSVAGCASRPAPTPVTVQLSWFHTVEFAGFYVAAEKGYYADENLSVTLSAGGPGIDPVAEVTSGRTMFGITTGDTLIRAHIAKQDIVALATIFRANPLVIASLPESGIKRPEDLVGKRVGVVSAQLDSPFDIQFLAMLQAVQVDPADLTLLPIEDYHGVNELLSGRLQAISGFFLTNEPIQARLDGYDPQLIFYSDYGIQVYPNVLFANRSLINEQPDVVQRFVRATLKGYQYAIEHPAEAAQLALKYDPTLDIALQTETMLAQIPLIDTGYVPLGTMDRSVWEATQATLLRENIIPFPIDLSQIFTNQFTQRNEPDNE